MKSLKIILVLLLALGFGTVASVGTYKYLKDKEAFLKIKIKPAVQSVVVASRNIPWGNAIKKEDVIVQDWLKNSIPKGSFSSKRNLIGRVTKREIIEGEALLPDFLLPKGGILGIIPHGMRAMSIEVDKVISVHGFMQPNSYVDVIATIKMPKPEEDLIAKTILQNIKVLAIGDRAEMRETSKRKENITTVTLALLPQDAEKLTLAINKGKIHLVLRNYKDRSIIATYGTTSDTLLGIIKGPEKEATYKTVEVIRGEERSEAKFGIDSFVYYIRPENKNTIRPTSVMDSEYQGMVRDE